MGKRELNKQANRSAILDAACKLFLESGYDVINIRDIIGSTDLATGTFYNYFQTKEEVLRALIDERVQALAAQLHGVRQKARSLDEFVHGVYLAAFTAISEDPVLYHLMMRNEAAVRALYHQSVMGISLETLKADIRDAIRRGIMPVLDVDYLASALFGAGYEIGRELASTENRDPATAAAFATRLLLGGIQSFASNKAVTLKPRVRAAN
ncbi:MAG: TetR/AcrR family transcriptional regulator [Pseudomonadota bacterium]